MGALGGGVGLARRTDAGGITQTVVLRACRGRQNAVGLGTVARWRWCHLVIGSESSALSIGGVEVSRRRSARVEGGTGEEWPVCSGG